jgi:hypothetical protein
MSGRTQGLVWAGLFLVGICFFTQELDAISLAAVSDGTENTAQGGAGENLQNADAQGQSDWCSNVTAADRKLGASPGEIWVSQNSGTGPCASVAQVSSNHTLRWRQGGRFVTSCAGLKVQDATNVSVIGTSGLVLALPDHCPEFSRPLQILNSTNVTVQGLDIDGNGNQQQRGEQNHDILVLNSNRVQILNNYLHDAQGDALLVGTDAKMSGGCEDVLVQGNSFQNIGRQQISVAGYGCNDARIVDNHFTYGTPVVASVSRGNPIHVEADAAGTGFQRITISRNDMSGASGTCISATSRNGNPIIGLVISENQCSGLNSDVNLSGGIVVLMAQNVIVKGNTIRFSGPKPGTDGILIQEASGIPAQLSRVIVADNVVEGASSAGIRLSSSASSGTPQSVNIHDNQLNGIGGAGIEIVNNWSELNIHDNILTNLQGNGVHIEAASRFQVHDNIIRDFGLNGLPANGLEIICNGLFRTVGPGVVEGNQIGNANPTGKTGIREGCSSGVSGVIVRNNATSANAAEIATGVGYKNE